MKASTWTQDLAPPNNIQDHSTEHFNQTTNKTGTQAQPSADRQPTDTPKYITSHSSVHQKEKKLTFSHQNTGKSPLHHEAYTSHWTNLTHWAQRPD